MQQQPDRDAIVDEAVGQTHASAPPYAEKEQTELSQEEMARRLAAPPGPQASTPEKTAASIGERVGDAYSDPEQLGQTARLVGRRNSGLSRGLSLGQEPGEGIARFATAVGSFALGYLAAVLFHGRINAHFDARPEPFQITKPPQGDRHPRGFVQSTVLKTITEHPQGMTTEEIIRELAPEGIGRQSVADALDALIRAEKIHSEGAAGRYIPAAPEIPTAPDQPSS
jgi:hypothetical protein